MVVGTMTNTPSPPPPSQGTQQGSSSLALPLSLHGIALVTPDGVESDFARHPVQQPQP